MRVLLVNPPRSPFNAILEGAPPEAKRFIHKKLIGPPLGLLTVAAALRGAHDVSLLEMKGEYDLHPDAPAPRALLRSRLEELRPEVVGVTCIASEKDFGLEILREAKAFDPRVLTVAGGLHATLCPPDFDDAAVDAVVVGQGEETFRKVLAVRERGEGLDSVGGLWLREEGRLRPSRAPAPASPPAFLLPDRSLLARWKETYRVGGAPELVTYLSTSLGCPCRCSFCSIWPGFSGGFYQRDVESVVGELEGLSDYGVVRFADANTLTNPGFIDRLFDRIEAAGIRKAYVIDLRMDMAARHPKLIEKMARLGLKIAIAGFESPRGEERERYRKNLETAHLTEGLRVCHENGVQLRANYVVPPSYGPADFRALADFAAQNATAYAGYTILTPMPGTELYREEAARIVDRDLARYNFFNCVLPTTLPLERFYEEVGKLWLIRSGTEVI
jgi:hopanoid C-3 methylase